MREPEDVPFEVPEWSTPSSPFSRSTHKPFRPEDLKDTAVGSTGRTAFFEKNIVLFSRELDGRVPFIFRTPSGDIRSLDLGCLKFLLNRREPELDVELENGFIVAVRPRQILIDRYSFLPSLPLPFDVDALVDERRKQESERVIRDGAADFRRKVLAAYGNRCAFTGTRVEGVLDAAHIYPYLGIKTNDVRNGIAMRVDVHRLFDGHLLSLEPENGGVVVRVASDLSGSLYEKLAGRSIRIPPNKSEHPAVECLRKHLSTFRAKTEER